MTQYQLAYTQYIDKSTWYKVTLALYIVSLNQYNECLLDILSIGHNI